MNVETQASDGSIKYFDGDYPGQFENLKLDIARYEELALEFGGPVLDLCCGTGRVAFPLAQRGFSVTGVEVNRVLLERFRERLKNAPGEMPVDIQLVGQDVTKLDLARDDFGLAILAFNSLPCIDSFEGQKSAIKRVRQHLRPGGALIIDAPNPFRVNTLAELSPTPDIQGINKDTGSKYTRFSMRGPLDEMQRQRLYGWYDEEGDRGEITRTWYDFFWRPINRFELQLMLEAAGLAVRRIAGAPDGRSFHSGSTSMFVESVNSTHTSSHEQSVQKFPNEN